MDLSYREAGSKYLLVTQLSFQFVVVEIDWSVYEWYHTGVYPDNLRIQTKRNWVSFYRSPKKNLTKTTANWAKWNSTEIGDFCSHSHQQPIVIISGFMTLHETLMNQHIRWLPPNEINCIYSLKSPHRLLHLTAYLGHLPLTNTYINVVVYMFPLIGACRTETVALAVAKGNRERKLKQSNNTILNKTKTLEALAGRNPVSKVRARLNTIRRCDGATQGNHVGTWHLAKWQYNLHTVAW